MDQLFSGLNLLLAAGVTDDAGRFCFGGYRIVIDVGGPSHSCIPWPCGPTASSNCSLSSCRSEPLKASRIIV
jgi:hypothetical protein